jgi:hypothetical protein
MVILTQNFKQEELNKELDEKLQVLINAVSAKIDS